ncbi:flagellar hook-basal body complex protein FliE [Parvularcula marina]|uniref:Flagellar hook-basal body complex protein FliE n=1 Tax=Parvularcula marina TaxID=2292771 RepID=A0A371RGZ2_9PROT|nr:flagellar hook-basal body complex protein FliE [Parvularcula marina]RFB04721.1 flagellar hook-basal body protein FliE [Parvularcula marina]
MAGELSSLGASVGYGQANRVAQGTASAPGAEAAGKGPKAAAEEFAKVFDKADVAVEALARGEGSAQAVVEAMAEAELALKAAVTVRDKVVEAYQDILRMPV